MITNKIKFALGSIVLGVMMSGCNMCDCQYIKMESNPTTNYQWKETYRSSWDVSCSNENLTESVYTDSQGRKWFSRTKIVCK
jgi:hypothetical protein